LFGVVHEITAVFATELVTEVALPNPTVLYRLNADVIELLSAEYIPCPATLAKILLE
jgi:hypothetical protein